MFFFEVYNFFSLSYEQYCERASVCMKAIDTNRRKSFLFLDA